MTRYSRTTVSSRQLSSASFSRFPSLVHIQLEESELSAAKPTAFVLGAKPSGIVGGSGPCCVVVPPFEFDSACPPALAARGIVPVSFKNAVETVNRSLADRNEVVTSIARRTRVLGSVTVLLPFVAVMTVMIGQFSMSAESMDVGVPLPMIIGGLLFAASAFSIFAFHSWAGGIVQQAIREAIAPSVSGAVTSELGPLLAERGITVEVLPGRHSVYLRLTANDATSLAAQAGPSAVATSAAMAAVAAMGPRMLQPRSAAMAAVAAHQKAGPVSSATRHGAVHPAPETAAASADISPSVPSSDHATMQRQPSPPTVFAPQMPAAPAPAALVPPSVAPPPSSFQASDQASQGFAL